MSGSDAASVPDLLRRLERLEAIEEIKALKARYARACDAPYDAALIASLFTEDGVSDGGVYGRYQGRDAIRRHFETSPSRFAWQATCVLVPEIEVDESGETASGRWYLWEPCTIRSRDGGPDVAVWQFGRYDDRYRRVDGQWLFEYQRYDVELLAPYDVGWAEEMIMGRSAAAAAGTPEDG